MLKKLRKIVDDGEYLDQIAYEACTFEPIDRINKVAGLLSTDRNDVDLEVDKMLNEDSTFEFKQLLNYMSTHRQTFTVFNLEKFYQRLSNVKTLEIQDGIKYDADKPYSGLIADFALALNEVAKVCTFGAKKYGVRNWKKVDDAEFRYHNAAWRHRLAAGGDIESTDDESGQSHIAHEIWNLLAQLTIHLENKND